jgi:hypothetical protein
LKHGNHFSLVGIVLISERWYPTGWCKNHARPKINNTVYDYQEKGRDCQEFLGLIWFTVLQGVLWMNLIMDHLAQVVVRPVPCVYFLPGRCASPRYGMLLRAGYKCDPSSCQSTGHPRPGGDKVCNPLESILRRQEQVGQQFASLQPARDDAEAW